MEIIMSGWMNLLGTGLKLWVSIMVIAVLTGSDTAAVSSETADKAGETAEFERGPHRGRLLKKGPLAVEITIFETGVPPQFRVYAYVEGRPIEPSKIGLTIDLERLGGKIDHFTFKPEGDFLVGDGEVVEPHSFDVRVSGTYSGQKYSWSYQSYEGRTTIAAETARESGLEVQPAGPVMIEETLDVSGRIDLAPGAKAILHARFPGQVTAVYRTVGEKVKAGERLLRVNSNTTLKDYNIVSPINGVVLEQRTNVGDVAGQEALMVIGDLTRLHVDLHIFPKDQHRVGPGQTVTVASIDDRLKAVTKIRSILPTASQEMQTAMARTPLPNPDMKWKPGMTVRGIIVVKKEKIPLGVRTEALQRFRDFTVVFARVGETYEVRMLELGRKTPQWTEVLGGINPGQEYVTRNSFLIKADIEKSGASHDH